MLPGGRKGNPNSRRNIAGKNDVVLIKPSSGWGIIDFKELRAYRDLIFYLVTRDIKVLYAQSVLGVSWAILTPVMQIIIFGIVFGRVAKVPTDGIPYVLFSTVAIIPWTYMSQGMTKSSQSLVAGQNMLGKVYFPRLIFPLVPLLSALVDFCISLTVLISVMIYYRVSLTWQIFFLPLWVLIMFLTSAGVGIWFSGLAIRFRDVRHAMGFGMRMLMYTAPIVYSASSIPEKYRVIYSINPLVTVIEGFRSSLLGTPFLWTHIWPGIVTSVLLLIWGCLVFKRTERIFADVI
jgi:lipopolysaccharide transport system permease protein